MWLKAFNFTGTQKLFILFALISNFCISFEYPIVRAVSSSLFIESYTASMLPYAWLAMVPLNFLVVALYNRYVMRYGVFPMLVGVVFTVIGSSLFSALFIQQIKALPFLLFIWKEVYILLMFHQLWSLIHTTIRMDQAKSLYGWIFATGALGGALGSFIPGFLAVKLGSANLLYLGIPFYLVLIYSFTKMLQYATTFSIKPLESEAKQPVRKSLKMIQNSPWLLFILTIVICMQVSSSLIDFQFNTYLGKLFPDKDLRTEHFGRVLTLINTLTVTLQLVGTYWLLKWVGLKKSHLVVPLLLGVNALGFFLAPGFLMISSAFVMIKAFDFSLFRMITEMLYIPLPTEEKFYAKSFIDVFASRSSKAVASFLIIGFQTVGGGSLTLISLTGLLIFGLWIWRAAHAKVASS